MYVLLGVKYIDFTNRQSGQVINGYQIFMYTPSENGVGMEPVKVFVSPQKFNDLFGNMNSFQDKILKPCYPEFGYKGRFEGMRFEKK